MKKNILLTLLYMATVCPLSAQTLISVINDKNKTETQKINELKSLLAKGTPVDTRIQDIPHMTPLMRAADLGNLKIAELLLDYPQDIDATDDFGTTALFYAARKGYIDIVRLLLLNGANVTKINKGGDTIILDMIRKYGANLEEAQKGSRADQFKQNIVKIIDQFINAGANINTKSKEGHTPIIWAALYNIWPLVDALKVKGADLTGLERHLPADQKNKPLTAQEKKYFDQLRQDIKNYSLEEGWFKL